MGLSRLGLHSSGQIPLCVVTVGLAHVCAVQPKVLVSDILLDVASRLRFEGGTLESTEGRGEHGTTEQNGADRGDIETKESKSIKREAVCEVTDRSTCILYVFHALSANLPLFISHCAISLISLKEVVVCGHSLEVNVTSSLDFYLSVAQVQLLQQLFRDNMVGMDAPEKSAEVHTVINKYEYTSHPEITSVSLIINVLLLLVSFHGLTRIHL